jgi:glycosyltransferase involved in cell wall biosynthesis
MKTQLSVLICTHNPRKDYLDRVLESLQKQSMPLEEWELILIDNASHEKLSDRLDLKWHPNGRVIREDELGLTAARLRGLSEFQSELAVFVDDDNVLYPDYLEKGCRISLEWPGIGAWGCQYFAEYDDASNLDPNQNIWSSKLERDLWTSLPDRKFAPFGGGMFIRRTVAEAYLQNCAAEPLRKMLDRSGTSLASYGDFDMAFTACDVGLGIGRFKMLKITHLIPQKRMTNIYLSKINHDSSYSDVIFRHLRGEKFKSRSILGSLKFIIKTAHQGIKEKNIKILFASEMGRRKAIRFLKSIT